MTVPLKRLNDGLHVYKTPSSINNDHVYETGTSVGNAYAYETATSVGSDHVKDNLGICM